MTRPGAIACACLAAFLGLAFACDGDDDADEVRAREVPADEVPGSTLSPQALFPLHPGDRWRVETQEGVTNNRGVTGLERSGTAVIHGTAHPLAERYRATDDEIALVDPAENLLVPVLRAPIRRGAEWSYALRDRSIDVPCEATVRTIGITERVAGMALEDCVEVVRRCEYPEGQPFRAPTTQTTEEIYCPNVGRVRQTLAFDPAPPEGLLPGRRVERVVGFRVRGGPAMPEPPAFSCEHVIILPSDVQAACGAAVSPQNPLAGEPGDESCTYRYRAPSGEITIRAERAGEPVDEAAIDAQLAPTADAPVRTQEGVRLVTGAEVRIGVASDRVLVVVTADPAACPEESALRLAPFLRSLIGS